MTVCKTFTAVAVRPIALYLSRQRHYIKAVYHKDKRTVFVFCVARLAHEN